MQISIYHINNEYREEYDNWDTVIDYIIECAQNAKNSKTYINQNLKHSISKWHTRLYLCNSEEYPLKRLSNFYSSIVDDDQPILSATKKDISTLFFIYDEDDMFVVPTGSGYFSIQDFLDYDFGLKIMSSIVDKNSSTIKNISYKSISGQVAFNNRMFRNEYSLLNEDDFGKLFNEICATISKEKFIKTLGLKDDFLKKDIICTGKSSFKISKTITVEQLFEIITKIKPLLQQAEDIFNSVKYINNKGTDKIKLIALNQELLKTIYDGIKNGNAQLPFDISHREYQLYHTASSFQIYYDGKPVYKEKLDEPPNDFQFLIDAANLDTIVLSDFESFCEFVDKIEIFSYNVSSTLSLTHNKFIKHINGEILFEGKTYFYIGEKWMQLEDKFIDGLNKNCEEYLNRYFDNSILTTVWDLNNQSIKDENDYINKVCADDSDCIKIHPNKTREQLELCDIIKKSNDNVQLIYIKDGFNHSIRDLTSQVNISQQRILEMNKSGNYSILEEYYEHIINSNNNSILSNYSKEEFIEMFKKDDLTFVLAFRPTSHKGYTFKDNPSKFDSNIAKYSLIHTLKEISIRDINYKIKLCEIKNC